MARLQALATSLAVHAVAFAAVVLVPVLGNEPLPEANGHPPPPCTWPMSPTVVFAGSPPAPLRRPAGPTRAPSGRTPLPESPDASPVATTFEPTAHPTDPGADICATCTTGDKSSVGPGTGSDGTGDRRGDGSDSRGGGPLRVGGDIRPPAKLRHVNPEYPDLAKRAGIRGEVVLECLIDASGRIADLRVLSGHPLLAPAAVNAVSRWLYTPTLLNGVAVPVLLTVTVRFNLGR